MQRKFASINPYNNALVKSFDTISENELTESIELANAAQQEWKSFSFEQRAEHLQKVISILLQNKEDYAQLITLEMGKPIKEARAEIEKCTTVVNHYTQQAAQYLQADFIATEAQQTYITYEPLGIVLGIMPWNFPFWQVFRFAIPAMMAGNAVLLKHAPGVPQCTLAVADIFNKIVVPKGLFQHLFIDETTTAEVLANPMVKMVSLTGSERAGAAVGALAGKNIKRSVLELGGSDAFIVLVDADIQQAAATAVKARFQNSGQSCVAAKRFIVVKEVIENFKEEVLLQVQQLKVGNPLDENTDIGPLANQQQADMIQAQIKTAISQGAEVLFQATNNFKEGAFVSPVILSNVKKGMLPFEEEIFGPVMSIMQAENNDDAIAIANATRFGLGASLWTQNIETAKLLIPKINSGMVFVNSMVKSDPRIPFGGINASGYGRELSMYGIKEFVNIKTVWIQ